MSAIHDCGALYPVIMCGGAGTRLWPSSQAANPKQFLSLTGASTSTFQQAVCRVSGIASVSTPIVIGGLAHFCAIERQLAAIPRDAEILLEPEPRDSAPAIAAAAAAVLERDEDGVLVVVASDHFIPDDEAFQAAVLEAAEAARKGFIVTLGVRPDGPSTAYGYIKPGAPSDGVVSLVEAFVEKPDTERALRYVADGYLWNSGNFVFRARTLFEELATFAPAIAEIARQAVAESRKLGKARVLGPAFRASPKISIDYAVMEKTARAAVLPVRFRWSDLGAWQAVWQAADKDEHGNACVGDAILVGVEDSLIRNAGPGTVAAVGLNNVALIVEPHAVLVCGLDRSQEVKRVAERTAERAKSRQEGFADATGLPELSRRFTHWLDTSALPIWWALGADHRDGGFHEVLEFGGTAPPIPRRARVQARQAYVYAQAHAAGWTGPATAAAKHGLAYLDQRYRRADGLYRTCVHADGSAADETPYLYDQAFVLLALAACHTAQPASEDYIRSAEALFDRVAAAFRNAHGGFREAGPLPFQSNPHMHLLEACLAWMEAGGSELWGRTADAIVELALSRFIDPRQGFLREFFGEDWSVASGEEGSLVEPGHQFEWAWLLQRWALLRGEPKAEAAARRLFAAGAFGIDEGRGAAVDALSDDMTVRNARARLWPQTERLKAALLLSEHAPEQKPGYLAHASAAASALWRYLETPTPGLWHDKWNPDGTFVTEPAPASSFYHLSAAVAQLRATSESGLAV